MCLSQVHHWEPHIFQNLAKWCSSSLLPTSRASWKLSPKFRVNPSDSRETGLPHSFVGPGSCMGREMHRSRGKLCTVPSQLRGGRRTGRFESSSGERRRGVRKRQGNVRRQAGSRPLLRSVHAKPNSRQQCSLTWKTLLAGWPSSKAAELLPFQHRSSPAMLGIPAASRKTNQPSATRGSHSAWSQCRHQSHPSPCQASSRSPTKKRCAANLPILPKYLQSWMLDKPRVLQQSKRSTPRFSTAADQEQEGYSDWAAMPRCSAFHAPVANILE